MANLESMMRSLVTSMGHIERVDTGQKKIDADYFVATENEAGQNGKAV